MMILPQKRKCPYVQRLGMITAENRQNIPPCYAQFLVVLRQSLVSNPLFRPCYTRNTDYRLVSPTLIATSGRVKISFPGVPFWDGERRILPGDNNMTTRFAGAHFSQKLFFEILQ